MAQAVKAKGMTYAGSGVNYNGGLDDFKQKAGREARITARHLDRHHFKDAEWTRGESIHLLERSDCYLGVLTEGLGTKSKVADEMYRLNRHLGGLTQKAHYQNIAQCCLAMIVNDAITLGAMPVEVSMYLALGNSEWFKDKDRYTALIEGWVAACHIAKCSWGSGETPVLKGVIDPQSFDIAGASLAIIEPKTNLIKGDIQDGDAIVMIESSGIHANGLTLARQIAERKDTWKRKLAHFFFPKRYPRLAMPDGYLTKMSNGRTYGEMLLDPTHIYVDLVYECLRAGIEIHYAVNITGHGWMKLMRAHGDFTYMIHSLPKQLDIFAAIQKWGQVDTKEMYKTFNMGAGFALYVPKTEVGNVRQIAGQLGLRTNHAGCIRKGEKKVVIEPLNITFVEEDMNLR